MKNTISNLRIIYVDRLNTGLFYYSKLRRNY
nr:MAG TPA: Microtubule end binding protein end binding protein complex.3A [Caudoviricetes sp.]DAO07908.1 MAG TPA: Microtubule end binding protein end binding protein complex.3A [Caudoviricetes sp.]